MPLIDITDGYSEVYAFFSVLEAQGNHILAYVIMPNHVHFLLHYSSTAQSLNTLVGNGKRFMAYSFVKRLKEREQNKLLTELQNAVNCKDRSRNKKHEVWERSFDVKPCRTEKFLLQKLVYIHENPLAGKWKLAPTPQEYIHSSCLYYLTGKRRLFKVTDYASVLDWENMYD